MISDSYGPSPYNLTQGPYGYEFFTDLEERYVLYFSDASGYFDGSEFDPNALMLGPQRLNPGKRSPHDPRVSATLLHFTEQAFTDNRTILVYVCDQSDNLEQQRHRLFNRLFERYGKERYVKHVLAESQTLYASLLYRNDNPFRQQVESTIPDIREKIGLYL